MPYVMVPVPEEHVPDILQRVLRLQELASQQDWDEESLTEFWNDADEPTRSLLSFVARAAIMGKPFTDVAAADAIQLSLRETATIMREANEASRQMKRPLIFFLRGTTEVLPNGRTVDLRLFVMPEELAKLIRKVEQDHAKAVGHPLLEQEG